MYSPKIKKEFIPALYLHSKDTGVPMTKTVNRYMVQGFASDALSKEAEGKLPESYRCHIRSLGLEDIVAKEWPKYSHLQLEPFRDVNEIMAWHEHSLQGIKKAYLGAEINKHHAQSLNKSVFNHDWLYRTLTLNLNRGLSNALVNYSLKK